VEPHDLSKDGREWNGCLEGEFPINTSAASSCSASTWLQRARRPDEESCAVTRVVSTRMSAIELMFEAC
jgi:hypothetical protein